MIEFIEKERYFDESPYTGRCFMYPTYMVKDGKEYFMFNRREPQPSYEDAEDEAFKKFLLLTDGRYFKIYGYIDDPLEILKIAAERKLHFTDPENLWLGNFERNGYIDFNGNFWEIYNRLAACPAGQKV